MDETTNLDAGINASDEELETATDGIKSEELDTTEVETDEIETDEVIDQEALRKKKNAEKAKKMLAEKNELKARIVELEKKDAIKDLKIKFWDFDEQKVIEIKEKHPTLSYEEAFILNDRENPIPIKKTPKEIWIVGREAVVTGKSTITYGELTKIAWQDQLQYKQLYEKIQRWELRLVKE